MYIGILKNVKKYPAGKNYYHWDLAFLQLPWLKNYLKNNV